MKTRLPSNEANWPSDISTIEEKPRMISRKSTFAGPTIALVAALLTFSFASVADAHCDTENGPVAVAARKALATGDVSKALIWVSGNQGQGLKATYRQARAVYEKGGAPRALAEQYFMENTVRLHRAAEGRPYAGLKPAQPAPQAVQAAEQTLNTGNLNPATDLLVGAIRNKMSDLFKEARVAREHRDKSVAAGREWTDAYVKFVIYTEGLYTTIQAGPAHGLED